MSALSRRLAWAQAAQVRKAGGTPVSLSETLAPEFHRRGESLFSPDRFHPNSAGYELAAGLLLPAVCATLGVWDEMPAEVTLREPSPSDTGADREPADEPRESVVARLTHRLTDFVRSHEDTGGARENTFLHNEEVDGDPESTGEAREAADTLRRRSRVLRLARPPADSVALRRLNRPHTALTPQRRSLPCRKP